LTQVGYANQLDLLRWADSLEARGDLPRLIRRLVMETVSGLAELSFPGGEATTVGGWDGFVRTSDATPFVYEGLSGWELSVEKNVGKKVDSDYDTRTSSPDGSPTVDCSYVAVAPRRWTKRKQWAEDRAKQGRWKHVRAIGLDDLETWLDGAPIAHAWISERLGLEPYGMRTIDKWWDHWSLATKPPLSPQLLLAGRDDEVKAVRTVLAGPPGVITISASSRDEVLGFIAAFAILEDEARAGTVLARTAFVDQLTTWRSLRARTSPLILVAASDAVSVEAAGSTAHHLVVPVMDAASADITLRPIDAQAASTFLRDLLGPARNEYAEALARLARMSLIAMRRRLAVKPELMRPAWAVKPIGGIIRSLLLANRWNESNEHDKRIVGALTSKPYESLASEIAADSAGEDPFLARVDDAVIVVSPYDAWLLLRADLYPSDLARFRDAVLDVLGAVNPALELPPDERWQAPIRDKSREHSRDLRQGVASSLGLLGALGDQPMVGSISTARDAAAGIVRELLASANLDQTGKRWASLDDVLPLIAEAAPDEFLAAVGRGLQGDPPPIRGIFGADDGGMFSQPTHSGILWALETCAWSNDHLGQVVELLAKLDEIDPGGRYSNRPIGSLRAIFCPWYPQNSTDNRRRLDIIDGLRSRHAAVARKLMTSCLPHLMDAAMPIAAPRYRQWKAGEAIVLNRDYWEFVDGLVERLVADSSVREWPDLVDALDDLPDPIRERALERLRSIAAAPDLDPLGQARIWEKLRSLVAQHREFEGARWRLSDPEIDRLAAVADLFKPHDLFMKHAWLFAEQAPSLDGMRRANNFEAYENALADLRVEAANELATEATWEQFLAFARTSNQAPELGVAVASSGRDIFDNEMVSLLDSNESNDRALAHAYCFRKAELDHGWLDSRLLSGVLSPRHRARLLLCMPDRKKAWTIAGALGSEVASDFWREFPFIAARDPDDLATIANRAIDTGRIGWALDLLALWLPDATHPKVTNVVLRGLGEFLKLEDPSQGIVPAPNDFETLFAYLDRVGDLPTAQIAQLEWGYLAVLEHSQRKMVLFKVMAETPDFFIEAITRGYRPRSGPDDESEESIEPPDERQVALAHNIYRLLREWDVVPGTQPDGTIDPDRLRSWVHVARAALASVRRSEVGDIHIGEILSRSPVDADGLRPVVTVRDLIEELGSQEIERGLYTGMLNARGTTSRGLEEGGSQERSLAEKFSSAAGALADRWPATARVLRAVRDSYDRDARREEGDAERFRRGLEGSGGGPLHPAGDSETADIVYFAYGSNMSRTRLTARLGDVADLGAASVAGWRIRFNKKGKDGTGKTNLARHAGGEVHGVLFRVSPQAWAKLASLEIGYAEEHIGVVHDGHAVLARTFVAREVSPGLRPSRDYLAFLIEGAEEHKLPAGYVARLNRVRTAQPQRVRTAQPLDVSTKKPGEET
jgi:hypothetical protein